VRDKFNAISSGVTKAVGSPLALFAALSIILIWAAIGPIFSFSDTWQLVINTLTTLVTFVMVFVIQASQNRDSKALHLKIDELILSIEGARNEMITAETATEEEIAAHAQEYASVAAKATDEAAIAPSQQQDEAENN
jgi:low affinity Fe/Cu permease